MNNQFEKKNALVNNLIACTNSDNYKIRAAAYTALGNFVDIDEVLYKMKDGIEDSKAEVREAATKSLKKIYNERKEKEFFQKWLYEIEELRKIS
ncbi:HEAT repeat domain-containing protein [Intestinibacter sp.]|uniref:HEAT repeat domain-containing protein n=1 Tax=Intestinibacter sp. TaxID=1965304 RepID=UPI002A75EED0|nr:HEAT repeat domain-containing protein [Intestinibacter sp.]MDY2736287.1 HEAT repeat domain-containing protein [Intestinibacter sp.]MDY4574587.1 HEAT repeat domain-containing protein [Intestinibacter sp.]